MSATELRSAPLLATDRSLTGWGRTRASRASVLRPRTVQQVLELLGAGAGRPRGLIARGAGRSYGDAAQNAGGAVLDMTGLRQILSIDRERRLVSAEAGVTVGELLTALAAEGLMLPVVPGTSHVTLAGAIASDIHGKNHHRDGGMARHVIALSLCTPGGERLDVSPESDPELFYATLGGMGLTGVIVQATVRAEPLPACVADDVDRTDSLEETLELMTAEDPHRYSVAWLDLLVGGSKSGRAIVSRSDPLPKGEGGAPAAVRAPRRRRDGMHLREPLFEVPRRFPGALLHPAGVRAFNALRWRSSPRRRRGHELALAPYFFPLDVLGEWNRLYGRGGLIQYQFVVPAGQEGALMACFELIRRRRLPVYLAVFKRLGPAFGGPLSFPLEGWTLAADLPADAPGLGAALDELDVLVAGCGGRVYLSKDVRMRPGVLPAMYPELERFEAQRARVDPEGILRSDLGSRLGLCGALR